MKDKKRVPFRTTIDANLLERVKSKAAREGVYANDIIERYIMQALLKDESVIMTEESNRMTNEEKRRYIKFRITEAIEDELSNLGFTIRDLKKQKLVSSIAAAVADLVLEDQWIFESFDAKTKK